MAAYRYRRRGGNRAPWCITGVKRSHPFAHNLEAAWVVSGRSVLKDLAGRNHATLTAASALDGGYATDGQGFLPPRLDTDQWDLAQELIYPYTQHFYWTWRAKLVSGAGNEAMPFGNSANASNFSWMVGGSYLRWRIGGATHAFTDSATINGFGGWHTYTLHNDAANTKIRLFRDGEAVETKTRFGTNDFVVNCLANGYNNSLYNINGHIPYVLSHRGKIADEAIQAFHRDPKAFFTRGYSLINMGTTEEETAAYQLAPYASQRAIRRHLVAAWAASAPSSGSKVLFDESGRGRHIRL